MMLFHVLSTSPLNHELITLLDENIYRIQFGNLAGWLRMIEFVDSILSEF